MVVKKEVGKSYIYFCVFNLDLGNIFTNNKQERVCNDKKEGENELDYFYVFNFATSWGKYLQTKNKRAETYGKKVPFFE